MTWTLWLLLLASQDEPVKVKEPDFDKVKGQFDRFAQAQRDLDAGAVDRALASARELLKDAAVSGYADRKIQVVRLDRMTRAWTLPVGDPKEFYPRQIAARALLELAKSESDPARKLKTLEEARELIQSSQAENSRRFESAISAEIDGTKRSLEASREDPSAPILREAHRLRDAKDFKGALAHLEKNRTTLGESYASLKADVETAQQREIAGLASGAKGFLEKLRPEDKLETLSRAIRAYLPDPDKYSTIGSELEWLRSLADVIDKHRGSEYLENAPVPQVSRDLEGLLKTAMDCEDIAQARAAIRLRGHVIAAAVKRKAAQARKEPAANLEKHIQEARALATPVGVDLERVSKLAREASDPGRRTFLGKVSEELAAQAGVIDGQAQLMPAFDPALETIRKQLDGPESAVYGAGGASGYRAAISAVRALVEGEGFSRWHPELQSIGRSLAATLLALEGFRQGRPAEEIRAECRPFVGQDFRPVMTVSPKVKRLLEGLKRG
jgi:hypothetical protein